MVAYCLFTVQTRRHTYVVWCVHSTDEYTNVVGGLMMGTWYRRVTRNFVDCVQRQDVVRKIGLDLPLETFGVQLTDFTSY